MTTKLNVKPLRTFEFEGEMKTKRSPAFPADKTTAAELKAAGLVSIEAAAKEESGPAEDAPEAGESAPDAAETEQEAPKAATRRRKT